MEDDNARKIKKYQDFAKDKDFAMFEQMMEQGDAWNKLIQFLIGGLKGKPGDNGKDGIGIKSAKINNQGELILLLSDEKQLNLGKVRGDKGDTIQGDPGIGIKSAAIVKGDLLVELDNGEKINAGRAKGERGSDGDDYVLTEEDINKIALSAESQLYPFIENIVSSRFKELTIPKTPESLEEFLGIQIPQEGEFQLFVTKDGLKIKPPIVHTASPGWFFKMKDTEGLENAVEGQIPKFSNGKWRPGTDNSGSGSWVFDYEPPEDVDGSNGTYSIPVNSSQVVVIADGVRVKGDGVTYDFTPGTDEIVFVAGKEPFSSIAIDYLPV